LLAIFYPLLIYRRW